MPQKNGIQAGVGDKKYNKFSTGNGQLAIETGKQVTFTAPQIKAFLYALKRGRSNDENDRGGLINIFLRAVSLYDDRFTLILNGSDRPISVDDILLDEIEEGSKDAVMQHTARLSLAADAPPNGHCTNTYCFHGGFAVLVWL